jgi:YidC/Oxa1 family membrane protein insertase
MYTTFIFTPLYNSLIVIMDILPFIDAGVAVIIFTCIIRLILFPLSRKSIMTQARMKEVEPELTKIKEQYKDNKEAQAKAMMDLYKKKEINPFSSFLLILIQLPIFFAMYSVFEKGLPVVNPDFLYSFVSVPVIKMTLFGWFSIMQKSLLLSLLVSVSQYFQIHYSLKNTSFPASNKQGSMGEEVMKNALKQMKYVFPVMVFIISYIVIPTQAPKAAAVFAIYWIVSNIFTIFQEIIVRKQIRARQATIV